MRLRFTAALLLPLAAAPARAADPLPTIGPAPPFALTSELGAPVALADFHGKVVAITFIYTGCPDICPLLTQKMVEVQDELGAAFGQSVAFVSITLDPENDTVPVLKNYADAFGAKLQGWSFLTGAPQEIAEVERRYGVVAVKNPDGFIDHTVEIALVDRKGLIRVEYTGTEFDPTELRHDLESLMAEP
jgi:protein SCO1